MGSYLLYGLQGTLKFIIVIKISDFISWVRDIVTVMLVIPAWRLLYENSLRIVYMYIHVYRVSKSKIQYNKIEKDKEGFA